MSETETGAEALIRRIADREARIAVMGAGYVGLPLLIAFAEAGYPALALDVDRRRVEAIAAGRSPIGHVPSDRLAPLVEAGRLEASTDPARLAEADAILICVPTPVGLHREPDLSFVEGAGRMLAHVLRPGQLVVLESTSYPGTTDERLRPLVEASGLRVGSDLWLAFSPEREDPGNRSYGIADIPKVVGADDPASQAAAIALYGAVFAATVPVSSSRAAEAVKLLENAFRSINIALVNEFKVALAGMGVDIWEVVEAAATKPFGFMPFRPGPGVGGLCIPVDPYYLSWKAREVGAPTRLIETAGDINEAMPAYVVSVLERALGERLGRPLARARVLLLGIAYKSGIDDLRESPALDVLTLLEARGALVDFHDPLIARIDDCPEHPALVGRESATLEGLGDYDAVVLTAVQPGVPHRRIAETVPLFVDTLGHLRGPGEAPSLIRA